jgi:hypothetical protein
MRAADAHSVTMSREIAWQWLANARRNQSGNRSVSVHDAFVLENGAFDYIDNAERAKVDIGCRSIHMLEEHHRRSQ